MKKVICFLLLSVLLPGLQGLAQHASLPAPPSPSVDDITASELRSHVTWLASDALRGRGTGTPEIELAAEYIAREFERYGLEPAGDDGSYFQTFEVITDAQTAGNSLTILRDGHELPLQPELIMPYTFSTSGTFEGRLVYAGHGISDESSGHDDYASVDAKGRIVLVRAGLPDDADPHGRLGMLSTARAKALVARERGAVALLIMHDDERVVREFQYDRSPSDAGLPVGKIQTDGARMLLDMAGLGGAVLDGGEPHPADGAPVTVRGVFHVTLVRKNTRNVIGRVPGSGDGSIVLGAHYDHLGMGGEGSLYRGKEPMVHNGADDNASGTAGVLEAAQWFAARQPRHSMLFMAFSGEEMGLLGSAHWVEHPTVPLKDIRAMVNLDMIGRLQDSTRRLNVQGVGTSPVWKDILERNNDTERFNLGLLEDGQGASDHSSFYMKGIPVLFFFTGLHTDYHRPSDDADKLDYESQETVTRYIAEVMAAADALEELPFTKVARKESQNVARFNVYVGTIPDYAANEKGFRISGTSPGSPAEKAGMKEGDIIVQFGETEVRNIYDYMTALSRHQPGEDVPVVVLRGEEEVAMIVSLVSK